MCMWAQQEIKSIQYALLGSHVLVRWSFIISTSVHACFMSVHLCFHSGQHGSLEASSGWHPAGQMNSRAASQLEQQPQLQITFPESQLLCTFCVPSQQSDPVLIFGSHYSSSPLSSASVCEAG